ncbi:hypothetical protein ACFVTC_34050 [Streptomyces sp. NPDC057950]|uniref:hypothetical protein n=1 Tax=Streptomyces sp. NPDC057950 TaxID=3346288 RepID=UPI0036E184BE
MLENDVLILKVEDEPDGEQDLASLVRFMLMLLLLRSAFSKGEASDVVIKTVMEAHRECRELDVLMSVVTARARARRVLRAHATAHGRALVVHARADTAIATAAVGMG